MFSDADDAPPDPLVG